MTSATSGRGPARLAVAALALVLIVAGFLLLAWSSVAAQLQAVARRELAAFVDAGHALRWSFQTRDAVVMPGSLGLAAAQFDRTSGLSWQQQSSGTDISLRLPRPALALHALHGARLALRSEGPVRLRLWAADAAGVPHPGAEAIHSGGGNPGLELGLPQLPGDSSAQALRLHLEAAPGTRIELHRLDLYPSTRTDPAHCRARDSVAATLAQCGAGASVIEVQELDLPERLLGFRDALQARSLAVVVPAAATNLWPAGMAPRLAPLSRGLPLLGLALAIAVLVARFRGVTNAHGPTASWQLLLLVGPAVLLWLGIPGENDRVGLVVLAYLLCLPLLLVRSRPPWSWLGNAVAWKAAAGFTAAALAALALFALLNAADADGFAVRLPDLDKLWIYPAWALLQQFLLIEFIAPRTRQLLGTERGGALLAGAVFGLLHLPNFCLMLMTLVAGSAWSRLGYRHQALLPLVISHAVLGLLGTIVMPSWLLRSAEVGGRFLMAP